jgi:hypothetical protein
MGNKARRAPYVGLWIFALAFGWIEAAAVVYLREIYLRAVNVAAGFQFPLVSIPAHLVPVEIVREGCTLLVLGSVAWLAGRRWTDRMGAFLLTFGIWDLAYYGVLRLVLGWPDSLTTWDILFLIPLPWVAPIWAPATVAGIFVVVGTYLFWTAERPRQYSRKDIAILLTSALVVIAAFLVEWRVVLNREVPQQFPLWLFWTGVVVGTSWFVRIERRAAAVKSARASWVGVHVRPALPENPDVSSVPSAPQIPSYSSADERREANIDQIIARYAGAKRRLDALVEEADAVGERLERLGHGLSAHPMRMIIGLPDRYIENPSECDIVPGHALPPIERLMSLTDDIREATQNVGDLRERLILLGRADVVEQPDEFFK